MSNRMMLQGFEWYLPEDARHWKRVGWYAGHWAQLGVTDVWLPPAYKSFNGIHNEGYGVYDLYDLGEFDQKGSVPTKYGTKDEYLDAINALHARGIRVLADIVLNHRMGADGFDRVSARKIDVDDRNVILKEWDKYKVPTRFLFKGRHGKYCPKQLNHTHFYASDYALELRKNAIVKFGGDHWSPKVSPEKGNFQYLMGVGTNFENPEMVEILTDWGKWYMDFTGVDGVRLDALKHIPYDFYPTWLKKLREHTRRNFFAVGEYWDGYDKTLNTYLKNSQHCMSLFDVSLHYRLRDISIDPEGHDLRQVFDNTLVSREPDYAVTFVDNHDTQPGAGLASWVLDWFKPLAYALILLQDRGTPCVFYGDLYGLPHDDKSSVPGLRKLMKARRDFGNTSLFEEGWRNSATRKGWSRGNGLAVVMSTAGAERMYLPAGKPGQRFVDLLGNCPDEVIINQDGWGEFRCNARSVSVWVSREYAENLK